MKKRSVSSSSYRFLENETAYLEREEIIDGEIRDRILRVYEPREEGMNYIRVILAIGAILVGLGILSFIASNWKEISNLFKLSVLTGGFLTFAIAGRRLEHRYPKTGRSLIYVSMLIFGAGIFLVEQMYNISVHFSKSFLLWTLGVLPMAYAVRDRLIFLLAHILLLVHGVGNFDVQGIPWDFAALLLILYAVNKKAFESNPYFLFVQNLLAALWVLDVIHELDGSALLATGTVFAAGAFMKYALPRLGAVYVFEGNLFMGCAGLFLTFAGIWRDSEWALGSQAENIAIIFGIALIAYFLIDTRQGRLSSLFFVCALIFRYYVDNFYDFMPKSMFFILGGLILIAFGFVFERMRRREERKDETPS